MIQPYLSNIEVLGETSLIFIGSRYSHSIRRDAILRHIGLLAMDAVPPSNVAAWPSMSFLSPPFASIVLSKPLHEESCSRVEASHIRSIFRFPHQFLPVDPIALLDRMHLVTQHLRVFINRHQRFGHRARAEIFRDDAAVDPSRSVEILFFRYVTSKTQVMYATDFARRRTLTGCPF
jgi:hypothetical protein